MSEPTIDDEYNNASEADSSSSGTESKAPSPSTASKYATGRKIKLVARSRSAPDDDSATIEVTVDEGEHEAFHFRPEHYGGDVIFLNAEKASFYSEEGGPMQPRAVVWVLLRTSAIPQGYVTRRLFESGKRSGILVQFKDVRMFNLMLSRKTDMTIIYGGEAVPPPDCVIPRVGAAADYFALAVVRQLERLGAIVLNNFESIDVSRDKLHTLQLLAAHGMPVPNTLLAKFPIDLSLIEENFDFPLILKRSSGSQGKGVMRITSREQLEDVAEMLDTSAPLCFQEFITASSGRDIRVFVAGGRVVASMMRVAATGAYKANIHQGGKGIGIDLGIPGQHLALEIVKLLGLEIAGVDLLLDKNGYKVCEVNSSPGFDGLEAACGVNVAASVMLYVRFRLGLWRKKKGTPEVSTEDREVPVQFKHTKKK